MAQVLYINPDPATQDRATELGCGWMPSVPAGFQNIAEAPCVILNGAGYQVVLPDDGTLTFEQVMADLQPMLYAEAAVVTAKPLVTVQVDPDALAAAQSAVNSATTVASLRKAVNDALTLLTPSD